MGRHGPTSSPWGPTHRRVLRAQRLLPDLQGIMEEVCGFFVLVLVPVWKPRDGGGWPGVGAATATGAGLILAGPGNLAEASMGSTLWGPFMGPYIPSNSLTPGPVSPDLCQASNHPSSLACSWGPWCLCSDSSLPGSVPRQPARSLAHSLFAVLTAGAFPSFPILAVPSSNLPRCSMVAEGTPGSLHLHPMGPCRSCPLPWPAAALTGIPAPGC